jgi:hypothetical protein
LTALAFAASKEQRESGEEPTMKIYYEEFSSVPYGPTTAESIEKWQDLLIWFYGDHQFIGNFKKLLEKKKTDKSIDDKKIRLKAVIKNGDNESIYLVDYYGIVAKSDTKYTYILTKEELKKINDELVYFHGVVDQRPTISPW